MKKKIAVLALGMISVFVAGQEAGAVMASGLTASAQLDWSTFQVRPFDVTGLGAPGWEMSDESEASTAQAGMIADSDYGDGWTVTGVTSEAWGSYATGTANNTTVSSFSSLNWDEKSSANSSGSRSAKFTITGTGLFTVSIGYLLQVSLAEGQEGSQSATAWSQVALHDANYDLQGNGYSQVYLPLWDDPAVYSVGKSGTLAASLFVTDGMEVYFDAYTYASVDAPDSVPVPPALLLLGSGVIGLLAARRKVQA
jgi:hypothetical protein